MSREVQQLPCGIEVYPAHTWMDWMYLALYTLGRVMAWALVLMALWSCARAS